jgi:hypothetical protein
VSSRSAPGCVGGTGAVHIAVNITLMGIPLTAGMDTGSMRSREDQAGGNIVDGFVFAYSLRRVLYKRKKGMEQRQMTMEGDLMANQENEKMSRRKTAKQDFVPEFCG